MSTLAFRILNCGHSLIGWLFLSFFTLGLCSAFGQSTSPGSSPNRESEVIELSPFVIDAESDDGYRAANTLAGTRVKTSLAQTPAAISVMTKELLDDLGLENTTDFLNFAVNAGTSDTTDVGFGLNQVFDTRAKIRGFVDGTITRDYFPFGLRSDRFNIERVDLNRGPNAVLYGIGAPGGVINTTSKVARLNGDNKEVSVTVGKWNKRRAEMDLAVPLIRDKLALRLNAMVSDEEGWRDFEYLRQEGYALAATYRPFSDTTIRANYERVFRDQNIPTPYPSTNLGAGTWLAAGAPLTANPILPGPNPAPGILRTRNLEQVVWAPDLRGQPFRLSTIGADVRPDLAGNQASGFYDTVPGPNSPVGSSFDAAGYGVYFPEEANIGGPGQTSDNDYSYAGVFLEQRVGDLSIEVGYARHTYTRDQKVVAILGNGIVGDPNLVLPGAYYADGDSRATGGRQPGTLLPDIGASNPMAGMMYVDVQPQTRLTHYDQDHLRLSLGYELDLTDRSQWLGKHTIAGLWQKGEKLNKVVVMREYNVTPSNNQALDSTTNTILRRTYLDFSSPNGQRGARDPWSDPIPTDTGVTAQFLGFNPNPWNIEKTESSMVAAQSKFLNERIVITAGYRDDEETSNSASSGGVQIPNSQRLWSSYHTIFDPADEDTFTGQTATLGLVLAPLPWLGLAYNQSDAVAPQTGLYDIYNNPLPPRDGEGRDYGVRISMLEGRLYLNVNKYRTDEKGRFSTAWTTPRTQIVPALNSVLDTLVANGDPLPASLVSAGLAQLIGTQTQNGSREVADLEGRGTEVELVGRLAKGWSVSMNYSHNTMTATNIAPSMNGFLAEVSNWDGDLTPVLESYNQVENFVIARDNTPNRDFTVDPVTFNDTYDYAHASMETINSTNGQPPFAHWEDSFNVFTSYRFDRDTSIAFLREARLGLGANWRGAPIIGYDSTNGNRPIKGDSYTLVNLMVGKAFRVMGNELDVQINVNNLLGEDDLLPYSADVPGNVLRYSFQRSRPEWDLRVTYKF